MCIDEMYQSKCLVSCYYMYHYQFTYFKRERGRERESDRERKPEVGRGIEGMIQVILALL